MKKLIYVAAVALCAAIMVSCGGNKYATKIVKGSESEMDSLSYAVGANMGYGISTQMADLKFNWELLSKQTEKALLKSVAPGKKDADQEEAGKTLQDFFQTKRPERLQKYVDGLGLPDSVKYTTPIDFTEYDVFADDEERNTVSEAYGYDMGCNLRGARLPLHTYWFKKGFVEATKGESQMTPEQTMNIIQEYFTIDLPVINMQQSQEWLASIEKKSGVKKTESGLLYRIDRMGDENIKPTAQDRVKVDYEGKLRDGVVFDSSYERGKPAEFPLSGVIRGWTEGLQLVGKGGQITLWIPAELGYGRYGNGGGLIGPNEALEFKVELHDVTVAGAPAPAAEENAEPAKEQ